MNNGINAYRFDSHITAVRPGAPNPSDAAARPQEQQDVQRANRAPGTSKLQKEAPLSTAESDMIQRYFPESDEQAMRIYGPGAAGKKLNPGALGRHLDLTG